MTFPLESTITYSELKPGDIFVNTLHSGIFIGEDTNGIYRVANVLSSGYQGNNCRCSSPKTVLNAFDSFEGISIFRSKNIILAQRAATIALWASMQTTTIDQPLEKFNIRYDYERLCQVHRFDNFFLGYNPPDENTVLHNMFYTSGLFRAVKFTARTSKHLIQPVIGKMTKKKGFRCAFATTLFYQIAALKIHKLVDEIFALDSAAWASNKYVDPVYLYDVREKIGEEPFKTYLEFLNTDLLDYDQIDPFFGPLGTKRKKHLFSQLPHHNTCIAHKGYIPAMYFWQGLPLDQYSKENIHNIFTEPFCVDAKYVSAESLLKLLSQESQKNEEDPSKSWNYIGNLDLEKF